MVMTKRTETSRQHKKMQDSSIKAQVNTNQTKLIANKQKTGSVAIVEASIVGSGMEGSREGAAELGLWWGCAAGRRAT